jgi:hypothetical protein
MSKEEYKILPYFFGNKLLVIDIFGFIGTELTCSAIEN